MRLLLLIFAGFVAWATPARAQPVDLLLVLAVDASGSIDPGEFQLQRQGYAEALADARVLGAVRAGRQRAIGVAMVEWGSPGGAVTVVGWHRLADEASAARLAEAVIAAPRSSQTYNAIGDGIAHAAALIAAAPWPAAETVIDVSGDGPDMRGRIPAPLARDAAVAAGITINALAVFSPEGAVALGREPLDQAYERDVIGGPGAFVMVARDRSEFAQAILAKLVREIAGMPGPRRYAFTASVPSGAVPAGR
jgi:hypothetical protein